MKYLILFTAACMTAAPPAPKKADPAPEPPPAAVRMPPLARTVQYGPRETIRLTTRPLYITTVVLPVEEKVSEYLTGDAEFWLVRGFGNIAWIKPSLNNRDTSIQLVTMSGNVYTFHAVSDAAQETDFKVFVEPKDEQMLTAMRGPARFVEASSVAGLKEEIEQWRIEAHRLRKEKTAEVELVKAQAAAKAPGLMKYEYLFDAHKAPFHLIAMGHDDRFTYIWAKPEELPALYEVRDGKPSLVQFQFADGMYTVDKVLGSGYFQMGKAKQGFERRP